MEIDPSVLKNRLKSHGIINILDEEGSPTGYFKGPWSPRIFDNYTETLKINQDVLRIKMLKDKGLNQYGQTKEQENSMNERRKVTARKKEKAEMAAEIALQNK